MAIDTPRTHLRRWQESDREAFAALNAHPEVMRDLGGPLSRAESDAKLDRFAEAFARRGFGRWVIESRRPDLPGEFLGYVGVMPAPEPHPLGPHFDIGWRLVRHAWGHGYATEAAAAALRDAFGRCSLREVVTYAAPDNLNLRSQAVMRRLGLKRDPSRDFWEEDDRVGAWHGLVWVARPT